MKLVQAAAPKRAARGKRLTAALAIGTVALLAGSAARADVILSWGSTASFTGTEASLAASTYGTGIVASGGAITRSGLGTSSGAGSLNSAGWTTGFLTFSLATTADGSYSLADFDIQDRASGTGPENLGLYYSGNNFAAPVGSWSDAASTGTREEDVTLSSLVVLAPSTTYTFEIKPTNGTSNNGGSTASAGTYRIISPTIELDGTAQSVAVPEPASLGLLGLGAGGLFVRRRRAGTQR
jgi:hypothetical protein